MEKLHQNLPSFETGFDMKSISTTKLYTNCFIFYQDKILLGMKKRGFGRGKFNGFGGKVDANESVLEAAIREVKEEANVTILEKDIKKVGNLQFVFKNREVLMDVHVFISENFSGEIQETEEMKPQLFELTEIPYNKMWSDDYLWFDYLLKKQNFTGKFYFDEDEHTLLAYTLKNTTTF